MPALSTQAWLEELRAQVDGALPGLLPARHAIAAGVHEAMAYALLGPGKRIRPALALAVGAMYRCDTSRVMPAACAIEMVHAASLILDDLPCMDDAPVRRGRASCHAAFGESTAILAAIGLLSRAFGIVAGGGPPSTGGRDWLRAQVARRLSRAIGPDGVIGGQYADLEAARDPAAARGAGLTGLEFIHSHKTGSLFIASAEVGADAGGATAAELAALASYARNLGLAFQITDDLIDATGDAATAGKPVGADAGRPTFVTLCGVQGARALASELVDASIQSLRPFGRRASRLAELARLIAVRDR
ncbi:MAG TPA: polyprenyl synthetase family protein [Candidatus Polarisedimenticolia bacterium]|nr:polyprenyl synthetase family protein [Candidatus Polarisedimenticolia bacterium]